MLTDIQKKYYSFFERNEGLEAADVVKKAIKKFKCSKETANRHYKAWRVRYKLQSPLPPQIKMLDDKKFKGKNGIYELSNGILLENNKAYLNFKDRNEWENFKREIDNMFDYAIDVLKVGL